MAPCGAAAATRSPGSPPRHCGWAAPWCATRCTTWGCYPGLLLQGQNTVVGEVHAITAALEARLDATEGISPGPEDEYRQREVDMGLQGPCAAVSHL